MTRICCGVVGEAETAAPVPVEAKTTSARRRRLEIRQLKLISEVQAPETDRKKRKLNLFPSSREYEDARDKRSVIMENGKSYGAPVGLCSEKSMTVAQVSVDVEKETVKENPKFGMTSVCGRRRDMEDAVAIHPSFCRKGGEMSSDFHFYGIYDGHGCSHVAMKCKDRLHELVREEIETEENNMPWKSAMKRSFSRMDTEVFEWNSSYSSISNCRCELQTPQSDAVGSTAVVAVVTPDKIIVSNCGDSRAVLCRNGVAIPLSSDHKPDRPDELLRIQAAGGRVIYWDGPRVLGVLAMSRAIGDNYLKPYVISEPEVTVTERTEEDECLILASDGLWDVVSNDTACGVARMCLRAQKPPSPPQSPGSEGVVAGTAESSDKACSDASILLTKLALARHSTDNVSVVVVDLRKNL
ncbi:PPM-type phosphatase-like domain [Dillenia turbinata]|uniref:protein-serine/threonine phosphatase n=1 Tax=Dillenia turbinata TaxID=194707 RepID=A0AAN8VGI3_9MAGN